ncbi:MAG: hypothetical protein KGL69_00525, partial [Alphaproteobacteria bacterium]|nr:hypothetical protein [Alphaproteobacteria bacterium]
AFLADIVIEHRGLEPDLPGEAAETGCQSMPMVMDQRDGVGRDEIHMPSANPPEHGYGRGEAPACPGVSRVDPRVSVCCRG